MKSGLSGAEPVGRLARVPSGVAELGVSQAHGGVDGPVSYPAVVDAVSVLPPVDERRRTGVHRTDQSHCRTGTDRLVALIVAGQMWRR